MGRSVQSFPRPPFSCLVETLGGWFAVSRVGGQIKMIRNVHMNGEWLPEVKGSDV